MSNSWKCAVCVAALGFAGCGGDTNSAKGDKSEVVQPRPGDPTSAGSSDMSKVKAAEKAAKK